MFCDYDQIAGFLLKCSDFFERDPRLLWNTDETWQHQEWVPNERRLIIEPNETSAVQMALDPPVEGVYQNLIPKSREGNHTVNHQMTRKISQNKLPRVTNK
jgi:hypothetical protein